MTVRTSILADFMKDGWTKGTGRKKDELGAYEDSEIINYVLRSGYGLENCDSIYLLHILPAVRLNTDYLKKLRRGMEQSEFAYILNSEHSIKLRGKVMIRDIKKLLKYLFVILTSKNKEKRRFAYYTLISALYGIKTFIPHIIIILKSNN